MSVAGAGRSLVAGEAGAVQLQAGAGSGAGKKKGRKGKGKAVPLFSNAGVRGGSR